MPDKIPNRPLRTAGHLGVKAGGLSRVGQQHTLGPKRIYVLHQLHGG